MRTTWLFLCWLLAAACTTQAIEPSELVPLYRFYNFRVNEHCYASSSEEAERWRKLEHLKQQMIVGMVATQEEPGTVRLYRGRFSNGRHVYFVGKKPDTLASIDEEFRAYVWVAPAADRRGVFCSTWLDGGDVFLDYSLERLEEFSENTRKDLRVERLRPQLSPVFFVVSHNADSLSSESSGDATPAPASSKDAAQPTVDSQMAARENEPVQEELFPSTVPTGQELRFDFKRLTGEGRFELLSGPSSFKLSEYGTTEWYVGNGLHGNEELVMFRLTNATGTKVFRYRMRVKRGEAEVLEQAKQPTPLAKDNAKFEWFPTTIQTSQDFTYNLASLVGSGKFELIESPGGDFKLSSSGVITWYAGNGLQGVRKLIFSKAEAGKLDTYYVKMRLEHPTPRPISSGLGERSIQIEEPSDVELEEPGGHTILNMAEPGGWVVSADGVTLIVSIPTEAALVYVDTVAEKETKRVPLSFQPAALTLQGDTLWAVAKGSSLVYALDAESGKVRSEYVLGSAALAHIACHPAHGPIFVSSEKFDVFSIAPTSGVITKTQARGYFLKVDPVDGGFVYTGVQPRSRDEVLLKFDESIDEDTIRIVWDTWGPRSVIAKYAVNKEDLKLVDVQNNAAVNGWQLYLSPDGKQIMMVGGGGWRPKDDGTGGDYITAIFSTSNLRGRLGQLPSKLSVVMHPCLDLGVINAFGTEILPFRRKSLVTLPAVLYMKDDTQDRRVSLLEFGGHGSKVLIWNGENFSKDRGLHIVPLNLTESQRRELNQFYGGSSSTKVATQSEKQSPKVETEPVQSPVFREWKDKSGKYSIRAVLDGFSTEGVRLKKRDGSLVTVPLSRLSQEDVDFINRSR